MGLGEDKFRLTVKVTMHGKVLKLMVGYKLLVLG